MYFKDFDKIDLKKLDSTLPSPKEIMGKSYVPEEPPVSQWTNKEITWLIIILVVISMLAGCPIVYA